VSERRYISWDYKMISCSVFICIINVEKIWPTVEIDAMHIIQNKCGW
jgi:hypothetical protein